MTNSARVLVVVVLYRIPVAESKTMRGLTQAFAENPSLGQTFELLLWDNSPQPAYNVPLPLQFTYHHDGRNAGVAGPYNAAADAAAERGIPWLLLLDHDTSVTLEYLQGMGKHAARLVEEREVGAVVPFLYAGEKVVSPQLWRFAGHIAMPRSAVPHLEARAMFAANSGTMLRVAALRSIGGYNVRFWLDFSDIELFHRMHRAGIQCFIAADLHLQHEIAMLDYNAHMTPARYGNYLAAESDFLDLYTGFAQRILHIVRLGIRTWRQRRLKNKEFSRMTWKELVRRLSTRRSRRIVRPGVSGR